MNNLPRDIYHELRSWLEHDDQVVFAMVNKTICRQLIKHVRVVWLREWWGFEQQLRSYLTTEKTRSLIDDPYNQLNVLVPDEFELEAMGLDDISISCRSLSLTVDQLTTSFIHGIKRVHQLMLGFYDDSYRYSLTNPQLQSLADWITKTDLGLKQLTFYNYDVTTIPVFPSLESLTINTTNTFSLHGLNLSAFSSLRCLKLIRCNSIGDVSSLDGIYELHLENCRGIFDISCLNHNYKIVIKECESITDYSNSFRCSKIIEICCPSHHSINSCDLSKAIEANRINFWGGNSTKPLILPQSLSLRYVQADFLPCQFTLPSEHHIQEIMIRVCTSFTSLHHFDRIYSIKLLHLNITSLEGLGRGNRVVEVVKCPFITDFRVLRHCDKVVIHSCEGFQDIGQVRGVKELVFSPVYNDNLKMDMEGVTCLILDYIPHNLFSLEFPSTLNKLVITLPSHLTRKLPSLLASLPHHVEKIVVAEEEKSFRPLFERGEVSFPDFIVEFKKGIHFLRKLYSS